MGLAFSSDGKVLATTRFVDTRPQVLLVPTARPGGPPLATITDMDYGGVSLSFSADGTLLAVADRAWKPGGVPSTVKIFDVSDPARPRRVASNEAMTMEVAFAPVGRQLATITSRQVLLHDLTDPASPRPLTSWQFPVDAGLPGGAFTPDGHRLVVGDKSQLLRIFEIGDDGIVGDPVQVTTPNENGN